MHATDDQPENRRGGRRSTRRRLAAAGGAILAIVLTSPTVAGADPVPPVDAESSIPIEAEPEVLECMPVPVEFRIVDVTADPADDIDQVMEDDVDLAEDVDEPATLSDDDEDDDTDVASFAVAGGGEPDDDETDDDEPVAPVDGPIVTEAPAGEPDMAAGSEATPPAPAASPLPARPAFTG